MFYAVRIARLVDAIGPHTSDQAPLRVLDAGCGKGHFSRAIASFGHRLDGIDTSETAIAACRSQAGPRESYAVAALTEWRPAHLYDAVISIDVLYHLMDDDEWEASVRSLSRLVRLGGMVGLVDHHAEEDRVWQNYQKTRSTRRYRSLLSACGFDLRRYVANDFRDDPSGMHVAVRIA